MRQEYTALPDLISQTLLKKNKSIRNANTSAPASQQTSLFLFVFFGFLDERQGEVEKINNGYRLFWYHIMACDISCTLANI